MTATPTSTSTALATIQPTFTDPERLALAGFLAGYRGLTPPWTATNSAPSWSPPGSARLLSTR